jgi:hypothetical protein
LHHFPYPSLLDIKNVVFLRIVRIGFLIKASLFRAKKEKKMTPTLPFSLSRRIEALFRERESLSEEQITYQVQELFQAAATSQEHSLIVDALQKRSVEIGSCPAIARALEVLNGGQKRVLEEGISSGKKRQARDPSASSSEGSSMIQQVWQWAEQTRNGSCLLPDPSEWNISSIPIISADGEGTLSLYHLFLLALHSDFVFSTLKFNINQKREKKPIAFEDFPLSIIQNIASALEGKLIALSQEEESLAILESAQFLELDKYALEKLLPLYTPFFQDERKSLQEFSGYLDHFQGLKIDLPLLADEVLAKKLSRMNAQQILDEETLFQGVQFLVSCYRKYPDSQVHEKLRSLFTPFVIKAINEGIIMEENLPISKSLRKLSPSIQLTITSSNIHLLEHPFVKEHLTHCTIGEEYGGFYSQVLDILQESFLTVMKRLSVEDPLFLHKLPEKYRKDPAIVLAAVKQSGYALQYASEELRGNEEILLAVVKQDGYALQYASEELRGNEEIVLAAVKQNGCALWYASEELRGNEEIVLAAVKQEGHALKYASEELRGNEEIVLAAVKQNGCALQYGSEELRGNEEIVLAAVQQNNGPVLWYARIPERK